MSDPTITLGGIPLPPELSWSDRYNWQSLAVATEYSLTGALIVDTAEKLAGRPITLQSGQNRAWMLRSEIDQIKALQTAGDPVSLSIRGETLTVLVTSVEAAPLWDLSEDATDPYCLATIKALTV